ncbi:hypothetical protein AAE478_007819 [Parahypoxylon ruwenzoriense]
MSRHQAYRNYDYENDLDEYEGNEYSDEEEELSPEDRAQMDVGTAEIQAALGSESSKVTTQQIQEALWHYYYDVDKSLSYLMSKFIAPSNKKKGGAGSDEIHTQRRTLFASFFNDMPWLNIPKDRETVFIEPPRVRGGLLGGASAPGKISKLQALAAARKKKAEDRKTEDKQSPQTTQQLGGPSPVQRHSETTKENLRPSTSTAKRGPNSAGSSVGGNTQPIDSEQAKTRGDHVQDQFINTARVSLPTPPPETAAPSAFAQALLGSTNTSSKKTAASTARKKAEPGAKRDEAVDGVKGLKIDDAPLPKSKNLDVLKEFEKAKSKKSASFVVVGHVDAGKSTLMGRLLLDLNVVDQRTIQKYRKEAESIGKSSFALAWVLDQRSEERSRGVTIDIATNKFETETTSFTILDAPGHRDFIPNMIAGASQADFAILVVDATTGAFEAGLKGQTREHALLIRSMGVSRVIVAVNKLDTVEWSQVRFDEILQQVSGFLSATGFQLKNVSFVPVSGLHGDNIVKRSADAAASWYDGKTLVEELESSEPMARALHKPLRLTISEVYRSTQSPLTVSGRIDSGSLQAGDALLVQPSGEKAYVKSLELDQEPVDWAVAGQNVVIHLGNIDSIHVRVGDIICDTKYPIACVDTFTAKVLAFDILMPMQVDVHRGRLHAAGQITEITALLDKVKGTVTKKKPRIVKPASVARVVVKMGTKVPLEAGLRVVLRSGGDTVAAGLLE